MTRDFQEYIKERSIPQDNGCWFWSGKITKQGYGYCLSNEGTRYTETCHRVSYRAFKGPIKAHHAIVHTCDHAHCVNPDHLVIQEQEQFTFDESSTGHIYTPKGRFHTIQDAADAFNISTPTLYHRFKTDDEYYQQR